VHAKIAHNDATLTVTFKTSNIIIIKDTIYRYVMICPKGLHEHVT